MFDFIRNHQRLTLGFLLLLIIPSFIFFGIDGYTRFTEGGNETVAKIDGQSVKRQEWDQLHQRQVERLRRQQGNIDIAGFDTPEARLVTLQDIVRQRTLVAASRDLHLAPSDARLQRLFQASPDYAPVRNPDGTVNREMLSIQGFTSEGFAQQLRQEFAVQQVVDGIVTTGFATNGVARAAADALFERREVQIERFGPETFAAKLSPSDAEIEAHYKATEDKWRATEQARIEYVVLDLETIGKTVTVPAEDLRRYYDENISRYSVAEQRRASHILVKAEAGASADDKKKAKARAEELLAQARKNPAGFAELARKNSEDTGSAAQGGDLDFFGRGAMVKPFEDAVFAMKPGEISNVVESDFGYHVIQLVAVRGGEKQPFEAVKAQIEGEVRRQLAQKKYAEAAEQFTNTVYEQSDSLQPVIEKFGLEKKTATVQRTAGPDATGPLASAKLLGAVFGNEALRNKRNTEAVETASNQMAAARVVEYQPARTRPLAEVKEQVRQALLTKQGAEQARKAALAKLAEVKKDPGLRLANTTVLTRGTVAQGMPEAIIQFALGADTKALPANAAIDLGDTGTVVVRVMQVLPWQPAEGEEPRVRNSYAQVWARAELAAYEAALKKRYGAEIKPAAKAASAAAAAASR
jgi:peptidyl-prolyl cis-trans isomerase D